MQSTPDNRLRIAYPVVFFEHVRSKYEIARAWTTGFGFVSSRFVFAVEAVSR
jgi:hypothetical protein